MDERRPKDVPIPLAFWFLFADEHDARRAGATLQAEGFFVDSQQVDDLGDWRLGAFKSMAFDAGQDLFNSMQVLGLQHDGVYLGFEDCRGEDFYPPKEPGGGLHR